MWPKIKHLIPALLMSAFCVSGNAYVRGTGLPADPTFSSNTVTGDSQLNTLTATGQVSLAGVAGAESLRAVVVASAVNQVRVTGAITNNAPNIGAFGTDTNIALNLTTKGTGTFSIYTNNLAQRQFAVQHVASAVNYPYVQGSPTATAVLFSAAGSDSNIESFISSKGTSGTSLATGDGSYRQFRAANTTSAVNYIEATGAIASGTPSFTARGSDTNIPISIIPKGTGGVIIGGTTTNDSAAAGKVGEYISSTLAIGSAVSLTTATPLTVTSMSLTAGDWDVTGIVDFHEGATTSTNSLQFGISTTNNTMGADDTYGSMIFVSTGLVTTNGDYRNPVPTQRISIASTTTVYLIAQSTFTVSTMTAYGTIRARRVR